MLKRLIERYLPDPTTLKTHKHLKVFGRLLLEPGLWHLNRRSVAGAFAVGIFTAWIPVPFQMLLAAGGAILWRVNLPVSVALVWLTNPVTMPPLFYGAYRLGGWLLQRPTEIIDIQFTWEWLVATFEVVGAPLLVGSAVLACTTSSLSYVLVRLIWRGVQVRQWRKRAQRYQRKE